MNERLIRAELRFLRLYAVVMSALAGVFLVGAAANRPATFSVIDAHVINVRDADGRVRLSLFGKNWEPPAVIDGKAIADREHRAAGLMFYNDRGDEIGGLIYGLTAAKGGPPQQGQLLTFDAYKQDQVVALFHDQTGASHSAGLQINDRPQISLTKIERALERLPAAQRQAASERMRREGLFGYGRLFAGVKQGDAALVLRDGKGRARLRISVSQDGAQTIQFVDANGRVARRL